MKFSTVIPLFNKQKSIRRAIYSVLSQRSIDSEQHELIVVDDGSTDNSVQIVNRIQEEQSERTIILHRQSNQGVSAARNKGAEIASSDYVSFLDADDSYEINFLEEIQILINNFPSAQAFATAYRFINTQRGNQRDANLVGLSHHKRQLLKDFFDSSARGDLPITSSSVCIAKSMLNSIGGFPKGENMGEDQAVWSQLALNTDIAISNEICANYFEAFSGSLMATLTPSGEMPFSLRLREQLKTNDIPVPFKRSIRRYISGHLLDLAQRNINAGKPLIAAKLLLDPFALCQKKRWAYWIVRSMLSYLKQ